MGRGPGIGRQGVGLRGIYEQAVLPVDLSPGGFTAGVDSRKSSAGTERPQCGSELHGCVYPTYSRTITN